MENEIWKDIKGYEGFSNPNYLKYIEIWKPVKDYEDYYEISNFGNLKILSREYKHFRGGTLVKKECYAKQRLTSNGYVMNAFDVNGSIKSFLRHRLVAEAFIPNPENKRCVNHKDGNKLNNHVDNLEWCTHSENVQHALKNNLMPSGEMCYGASLTNRQVREIRKLNGKFTQKEIGIMYGVSRETIKLILNNKTYKYA